MAFIEVMRMIFVRLELKAWPLRLQVSVPGISPSRPYSSTILEFSLEFGGGRMWFRRGGYGGTTSLYCLL